MTDILYYPNTRYASREELFEDVSRRLVALGYVDDSFERAIKEREESYPTGLPLDPPVAIPHTDGTHVKHDVIVCIRMVRTSRSTRWGPVLKACLRFD